MDRYETAAFIVPGGWVKASDAEAKIEEAGRLTEEKICRWLAHPIACSTTKLTAAGRAWGRLFAMAIERKDHEAKK